MASYQKLRKKQKLNTKQANQRIAEVAVTVDETTALPQDDPRGPDCGITWSDRRFQPLNLYPRLKPNQKPSPADIETAQQLARKFIYYFDHGKVALLDKKNNLKVIALIEFTPLERLSELERAELNTVATFLNGAKDFVNKINCPSRSWGGNMRMVGWRKGMESLELLGRYRDQDAIDNAQDKYDKLMRESSTSSDILGRIFKRFANVAFQDNRELMAKDYIPAHAALDFDAPLKPDDCASNLSFTRDDFYNPPHSDKGDISEFAFGLFFPISRADGKLAMGCNPDNVSGGSFVFPNYRCGIDFSKQNGVVKMVWRAKDYEHCTLPPGEAKANMRAGISLQINQKTASAARDSKSGAIYSRPANIGKDRTKMYMGDHNSHLNPPNRNP
ncbi:hypothetical protein PGTUg99_032923 [Puccinia graminis f. sp. tritici]|uniref:Tet-like 2OG-Fe(II) oxygenase domain-containing protein n=1 Tax=Puccinia graminis f. sp. tritici TaxID=56615 RepID=A0A5B0MHV2_PUCGR|nr:hypothetical protein PGTUg99_032923 [Puccinia graminis f. sp. tritici]